MPIGSKIHRTCNVQKCQEHVFITVNEIYILRLMCLIAVVKVSQHAGRIFLSTACPYCHSCLPLYIRSTFSRSSLTWSGRRLAIVTCFLKNSFTMSLERPNACMLQVKVLQGKRDDQQAMTDNEILKMPLRCEVISTLLITGYIPAWHGSFYRAEKKVDIWYFNYVKLNVPEPILLEP